MPIVRHSETLGAKRLGIVHGKDSESCKRTRCRQALGANTLGETGFEGLTQLLALRLDSLLAEQLGSAGAGVVIARVTPRSDNGKSAVVRELTADSQAAKLGKPNVYMLEGYIAARTLTEALRKAGKEPTQAKLRKTIEGITEWDMGGFRVSFDGGRNGSKLVELSVIDSLGKVRE